MTTHLRKPIVLVIVVLVCLAVYGAAIAWITISTVHNTSRLDLAEAKQQAQEAAAHQAEVTVCRRQLVTAPTTLATLLAVKDLIVERVATTVAVVEAQPDDPVTPIRRASIRRGQEAIKGLDIFITQAKRQTPTADQCIRLAAKYGISLPREDS